MPPIIFWPVWVLCVIMIFAATFGMFGYLILKQKSKVVKQEKEDDFVGEEKETDQEEEEDEDEFMDMGETTKVIKEDKKGCRKCCHPCMNNTCFQLWRGLLSCFTVCLCKDCNLCCL